MTDLESYLGRFPGDLSGIITAIAQTSVIVRDSLPSARGLGGQTNAFGERQTKVDVFANDSFAHALLSTDMVAEVASEEMEVPRTGRGSIHVAMDPLDGSSNISTNNPLGSIFGFYSDTLPCDGSKMVGAAYVTYGPMLTLTFSLGKGTGATRFVATGKHRFELLDEGMKMPDRAEVFGLGGLRGDWLEPVEHFVSSLESRRVKLRYGGTFVGDYNQVLEYGGIFGYPALRGKPKGKLRVLYEVAPMAYVTREVGGYASDGAHDALSIRPRSLADTTPVYLGSPSLVRELEELLKREGVPGS